MNDVHVHCFKPSVCQNRNVYFNDGYFRMLYGDNRSQLASWKEVSSYLDSSGTDRAILVSFPWQDRTYLKEHNEYFSRMIRSGNNRTLIFGNISNSSDNIESQITSLKEMGFSGVGEIAFYDGITDWAFINSVLDHSGKLGMTVNIHVNEPVGHNYSGKYTTDFKILCEILTNNSSTRVILSHLGGGFIFYFLIPEIRNNLQNLYFDISASPYIYSNEVYECALISAPGRILFGTDYPLISKNRYENAIPAEFLSEINKNTLDFFNCFPE